MSNGFSYFIALLFATVQLLVFGYHGVYIEREKCVKSLERAVEILENNTKTPN